MFFTLTESGEHELIGNGDARRVLIVAGGTGGHIAPALAVGSALRRLYGRGVAVRYLCGSKPIERQVFAAANEFPDQLACGAAPGLSLRSLPEWAGYARSIVESRRLLQNFCPHVVLATGGYVCAPVLLAARSLRVPYYLHESNSVAGRVTRLFASRAACLYTAYESAAAVCPDRDRVEVSGTPVREELFTASREEALARFDLRADRPVLLVLGGSQGARAINESVLDALANLQARFAPAGGLQVVWACGPLNYNSVEKALASVAHPALQIRLFDYLQDMHLAYAAADLVLSRAGASTLAEITALGLPSVLVPYPHAKDNHQESNAAALEATGAAVVLRERELCGSSLAAALTDLMTAPDTRARMADAARAFARPDCAERIARELAGDLREISSQHAHPTTEALSA